jgi:type II secretory pathway pseudopilin PulG
MRAARAGGFTLLELVVAMFLSATIVALVVLSWSGFSRHMATQERMSLLGAAAERVAGALASELRRASTVLSVDEHAIRVVDSRSGDTLSYELSEGVGLLRNGVPVYAGVRWGRVFGFDISAATSEGAPVGTPVLLSIALRLCDGVRCTTAVSVEVQIPAPTGDGWRPGGGWNFP